MSPSGARLARLSPSSLTDEQRAVYDDIVGGRRTQGPQLFRVVDESGGLEGPFNAFLLQPRLGGPLETLGAAVRYETSLSDRVRELAILVVALHWDSAFEWYAHEAVARHVGVSADEFAALREQRWESFDAVEGVVVRVTASLVADGDLDDRAYEQALATLGPAGLFELLTLVGYYAMLALQLRVFRVGAPRS